MTPPGWRGFTNPRHPDDYASHTRAWLLTSHVEVRLHRDRLLHQRAYAAVVGDHQHTGRGLRGPVHVGGHVEGARVDGDRPAIAAVASSRAAAVATGAGTTGARTAG